MPIFLEEIIVLDKHVINFYKKLFSLENNCIYTDLVDRTIPQLLTYADN